MVKFCPRTAPVLGPDLRHMYNNGNTRALLSASSIMPGVLSVFFSGRLVVITPILQVRKLTPENLRNSPKVIHFRGWGLRVRLEPTLSPEAPALVTANC